LLDYNAKTTTYGYDELNRLQTKTPDAYFTPRGDAQVSFTYTATGKRQSMTDASGTTIYTYDSMDRLKTKQTPQGTLTYSYDAVGNLTSMVSSNVNGISVSYIYDELNRLKTVVDNRQPSGQNTTAYGYDPVNNLVTVTYPNGVQSSFVYDDLNRLTNMPVQKASTIANYSYQLGATGNRNSATEQANGTTRNVNWTYDNIYRLTNESMSGATPNGSVAYGLDAVGNRLSQTSSLSGISSGTFTFDANDRLSSEQYDLNGNTTVTGARAFTYDFENRARTMTMGTTTVTLQYDGDGNRVAKNIGSTTTRYLVDDLNPTGYPQVVEEVVNGAVQRTYTYGLQRISQYQPINSTWTASFYGYDGMGSVRLLTNAAGAVTDRYDYDAWGNSVNVTGTTPNVYLYRGEQYDPDLTLYYLRARYSNPLTGRFITRDPAAGSIKDVRTFHKYLYSSGDPVNRIDPTGRVDLIENFIVQSRFSLFTKEILLATYKAAQVHCAAVTIVNITTKPFTGGLVPWYVEYPCDIIGGVLLWDLAK
jgi:RHS repeat-associated protein